jgi:hypothetical protein
MLSGMIRYGFIVSILALWGLGTYWAFSSVRQILRISNLDSAVTLRLVGKALTKNPFAGFLEQVRERADLDVSLQLREGYTFTPQGGEVVSTEFLEDRRQYLLVIANPGKETFSPIELRLQFPYPVETHEVAVQRETEGVTFKPTTMATANVSGGGQVHVLHRPLHKDYELHVTQMRTQGRLEFLLLLNSWRDPRGKVIPKGEEARYFVPESGPELTYIYGHFKYAVGEETIDRVFYVPLILNADKTVSLGTSGPPPERLVIQSGME